MSKLIFPPLNPKSPFADLRGSHVAVRTPNLEDVKAFYVGKLDFRVVAEWPFGDQVAAYLAPPNDDNFYIEVLAGGSPAPMEARPYTDATDSLKYRGYNHFCMSVTDIAKTLDKLRGRDVQILAEPFLMEPIGRKLAFFADPFGNLIELSETVE